MVRYIKIKHIKHGQEKIDILKSNNAGVHVELALKLSLRFSRRYGILEIDNIIDNLVDKGFIIEGKEESNL